MFDDQRFSKYHAKFPECKDPSILPSDYEGGYYVNPIDSIVIFSIDALNALDDEFEFNELAPANVDGDEPEPTPEEPPTNSNGSEQP